MTIKVTYNVTDVYVTQDVSPVYINVSYSSGGGSGAAVWGSITGTLSNQTDLQSALDLKVPYTGATTNVNLGEYEIKAGQVTLDTSPTGTAAVGTTRWNDTTGLTETTLKGGTVVLKNGVDLVARVVNKVTPNTTLTKANYQAVRVSGAQGQRLAVAFAQANNDNNSADTIGLVTETIATNQEGFIITVGQLENINTTGSLQGETWADGDVLYLSPTTAGALTNVKPNATIGHIVVIGYVEYAHAVNGKIYVKVMNGWELGELHDVYVPTPSNNDVLTYETSSGLWKNKSVGTALGYTPANAATTLTINGVTYDLSTSRTYTISAGISGSGASGQVAYWTGASAQSGSNNLFWDNANGRLGIGTNAPDYAITVRRPANGLIASFGSTNQKGVTITENANGTGLITSNNYDVADPTTGISPSAVFGFNGSTSNFYGIGISAIRSTKYDIWFQTGATNGGGYRFYRGTTELMTLFTSGNLSLGSTTDSGERLQVTGNVKVTGNVNISGGTQDYIFSKRSNTLLTLQSQNSGANSQVEYYAKDGDGTDDVGFAVFPLGIPTDITNFEQFRYFYSASLQSYIIGTNKGGTGSYKDIRIGNTLTPTDLVIKATTGSIGINTTSPNASARLQVDSTTQGFLPQE